MAKFVTLPKHYNRGPVVVNVDKVCFIEPCMSLSGTTIVFNSNLMVDVNLSMDEVLALFTDDTKIEGKV